MECEILQWSDRAREIRVLHDQIAVSMRRSIEDAIRIGEILSVQKQDMDHGKYIAWIKAELPFSEDTAERYSRLFEHKDKIRSLRNLQEAYTAVKRLKSENRLKKGSSQEPLKAATPAPAGPASSIETPPEETNEAKEQEQAIDDEYERQNKQKAQRQIISRIDSYLRDFKNLNERRDAIEALEAHLLDEKMKLPIPRTDAEIKNILMNFEY
jgi:hypothetical protein